MSDGADIFADATLTATHKTDSFTSSITANTVTAKRISIRDNAFRLMVNGQEIDKSDEAHLDVVIINASPYVHRMYYDTDYIPGVKVQPPVCWSSNSRNPDSKVESPQGKTCVQCPQNIKGSGPRGTKACRFSRRIAVVKADDIEGDIYQVTLPAQSIFGVGTPERKPLHQYSDYVRANGQTLMAIVSRMSFDPNSQNTKIGFKPIKIITDEDYQACSEKSLSEDAIRAIELTVSVNSEDVKNVFLSEENKSPVADSGELDLEELLSAWN
tara:strand:- start:20 stop:829 length:810 start_codon:yes stop_codon:yes gene_type:complete